MFVDSCYKHFDGTLIFLLKSEVQNYVLFISYIHNYNLYIYILLIYKIYIIYFYNLIFILMYLIF